MPSSFDNCSDLLLAPCDSSEIGLQAIALWLVSFLVLAHCPLIVSFPFQQFSPRVRRWDAQDPLAIRMASSPLTSLRLPRILDDGFNSDSHPRNMEKRKKERKKARKKSPARLRALYRTHTTPRDVSPNPVGKIPHSSRVVMHQARLSTPRVLQTNFPPRARPCRGPCPGVENRLFPPPCVLRSPLERVHGARLLAQRNICNDGSPLRTLALFGDNAGSVWC